MANECIPLFRPGGDLTATAAAGGVKGKTFVDITTAIDAAAGTLPTAATATAAGLSIGVAAYDTAAGIEFPVIRNRGAIVPVTAGGVIAAGAEVEVGADGKAVTIDEGIARGRAWSAGTADHDVFVELY